MIDASEWRPGSFTKNFTWGQTSAGLRALHYSIRVGFDRKLEDTPREAFRERVQRAGRIDFIPVNFFLFNQRRNGVDYVVLDELAFQALAFPHSPDFDRLALFAFLFSRVGAWRGSQSYQRYPALWAMHFIRDIVAQQYDWDASRVTADEIESYLSYQPKYRAQGTRKVATNLRYILRLGKLKDFASERIERWWVNAVFLAFDRLILDQDRQNFTDTGEMAASLEASEFWWTSGRHGLDKKLAVVPLAQLYQVCGGLDRFADEVVKHRTLSLSDVEWIPANSAEPVGALEPYNPRVLKTIPRSCAIMARYLGFETIAYEDLESFDIEDFVRTKTLEALRRLRHRQVEPMMTSDQFDEAFRGE